MIFLSIIMLIEISLEGILIIYLIFLLIYSFHQGTFNKNHFNN
jgi:hypothetical protein